MTFRSLPILALLLALPTLLLTVSCGGDGSGPVTASSMTAPGGTSLSGTVGQALLVQVTVTGSNGQPFAGGVVSFSVTSGGGSASPAQANTDQTGKASTTWTLGTTSGAQGLSASSGGASVQFTATAAAGSPASVESVTSFPGQFTPGEALSQPATFVVRDQFNNGVEGVTVNFEASDGGSADPAQGTTGSDGRVSTTWTLGPFNGTQSLSATAAGVTSASVSAEAYDPCLDFKSHTLGGSSSGTLTSESCELQILNKLRFTDVFTFTLNAYGAYLFTIDSDFDQPTLLLLDPDGVAGDEGDGGTLAVKTILENGSGPKAFFPWVAAEPGGVGGYTFSSQAIDDDMEGCETWAVSKNLETVQELTTNDCFWSTDQGEFYVDLIEIWLNAGETLVVEMSSADWNVLDPFLELLFLNNDGLYETLDADDDGGNGLNARLEYVVGEGQDGFYFLGPTSAFSNEVGDYVLSISTTGGAQSEVGPAPGQATSLERIALPMPDVSGPGIPRVTPRQTVKRKDY